MKNLKLFRKGNKLPYTQNRNCLPADCVQLNSYEKFKTLE